MERISHSGFRWDEAASTHRVLAPVTVHGLVASTPWRVFNAWTIPEYLEAWYESRDAAVVHCNIDLRVGGSYALHVQFHDGRRESIRGAYRRISAPVELACSFRLNLEDKSSFVSVLFQPEQDHTRVRLSQTGLQTSQHSLDHFLRWSARLDRLSRLLK